MSRRADIWVADCATSQWNSAGEKYLIQRSDRVIYAVYVDGSNDVIFRKSLDGGITWGNRTVVFAGTVTILAVWYDRWSSIAGDLIHCAYTESGTFDTLYRTINTASSDALSTQTTIFAGASTAVGGHLSIVRAVGGNVYCKTVIDAGAEGGFYRLPNANVPNGAWDAARTVDEAIATTDQMLLQPDFDAADTQDIMAIFWDQSASEISRKLYDDSANTWSETSIATSMTALAAATAFPNFAVVADPANTRCVLVAWSATDAANADLRCWTIDASTITEVTNVVLNSTDDQGLCGLSIDQITGYWHVYYTGISSGGNTWPTATAIYTKVSKDGGSTWGPETFVGPTYTATAAIRQLLSCPWVYTAPMIGWLDDSTQDALRLNIDITQPRANSLIGV